MAMSTGSILSGGWTRRAVLGLFLFVLISTARAAETLASPRSIAAWLAALSFVVAFLLVPTPPAVALAGLAGAGMEILIPGNTGYIMAIAALVVAARIEGWLSWVIGLVIAVAYLGAVVAGDQHVVPAHLLSPAITFGFAYLAASSFHRLRVEKQKTEALLQEVLAGRDAQVRAAALDERARLAREIHDILAHTLSALSLQLETVRMLVEQQTDDRRTRDAVERAGRLARDGLDETRRAVGTLRGDAVPGPDALHRLVAGFERDTGIPCRFSVEGAAVELSADARLALYRTAQEALTNIRKHAPASQVQMRLCYGETGADLTVENDGGGKVLTVPSGGHGLIGMRERAELARGTLEAGPTPTGFRVHLRLPA